MTRGRALVAAVALACACQEADPIAQTIVWIDAEPAAREALERIRVQATGPAKNREPSVETEKPKWPIKLVFAPKNADASRRFALAIEARDERGTRLATLRFRTGFVAHETRYAILKITDGCAVQPRPDCGEERSCNRWSAELAGRELSRLSERPRKLEVACEPTPEDAPPDAIDEPMPAAGATAPEAGAGVVGTAGAAPSGGTGGAGGAPTTRPVEPAGTCEAGWVLANGECKDVDECADGDPCGVRGRCENLPGRYACACEPGYAQEAGGCVDVHECETDNGGCEGRCLDSLGSFACACEGESWLRSDRKSCGSFGSATRLGFTKSALPMHPRFAFDARGDGLAIWLQSDGMRTHLWTRRFTAGSGWIGFASRVPIGDTGNASSPRVALDPSGRGVIAWLLTIDGRADLWAARYDGTSLGAPEKIELDDVGSALEPSVLLDGNGNGIATWAQSDGTHTRIRANRFDVEMGWSEARAIQTSMTDDALIPRLAMDAAGNAIVGWTQYAMSEEGGVRISPWTARFDAALGRWRLPSLLDESNLAGVPDSQLFEPAGHSVTVWSRATDGRVAVWARSRSSEADRREPVQIGPESETLAILPRIALSPAGSGAAIWSQGKLTQLDVWANRYDGATDAWSEPEKLSQISTTASALWPSIAVDASGDGFGVWSEVEGTSRVVRAARLQAGVGFVGHAMLAMDATADPPANSPPQIALDPSGAALAIWDVLNEGQYEVWARKFE